MSLLQLPRLFVLIWAPIFILYVFNAASLLDLLVKIGQPSPENEHYVPSKPPLIFAVIWQLVEILILLTSLGIYVHSNFRCQLFASSPEFRDQATIVMELIVGLDLFKLMWIAASMMTLNQEVLGPYLIRYFVPSLILFVFEFLICVFWNRGSDYDVPWLARPLMQPRPRKPLRSFALGKDFSARIIAVQHGSPPEMWAHKKSHEHERGRTAEPRPLVQPVKPTYDPKATRRARTPPPIMTTWNQWYITPGEV